MPEITWSTVQAPGFSQYQKAIYAQGKFFVVSSGGDNRLIYSSDGKNWTTVPGLPDIPFMDIAYGEPGGNPLFVAVGSTFSNAAIAISPDGINWTPSNAPSGYPWLRIAYGDGIFVGVANVGGLPLPGEGRSMRSTDGITWISHVTDPHTGWTNAAFGRGIFLVVGQTTVSYSPDGISWTDPGIYPPVPDNQAIRGRTSFGDGTFINLVDTSSGAFAGVQRVLRSTNGINWTSSPSINDNAGWADLVYAEGMWIAVRSDQMMISEDDGVTWSALTINVPNPNGVTNTGGEWQTIAYGDRKFVVVENFGGQRILIGELPREPLAATNAMIMAS